jgi:hypothetical protein
MAFKEKLLTSQAPVEVTGYRFKRYYVTSETAVFTPDIERAAVDIAPKLLPAAADGTPAAGFVVLHRGGDGAAYLNVYTWVWDNVLHMRGAAAGQPALDCPDADPAHFIVLDRPWIGCVWELAPVHHERNAWVRHMLAPDIPDLDGYLADSMEPGYTR